MITLLIILLSLVIGFLLSFIAVGIVSIANYGLESIIKPMVVLWVLFSGLSWIAIDSYDSAADLAVSKTVELENLKGVLEKAEERRSELTSEYSEENLCLFETPDVKKDIDTVIATIHGGDTTVYHLVIFKR